MRKTKQKELLEKELQRKTTFFTAEEFFQQTQKKDNNLGIATVYRFLKEKVKKNQIHKYSCNRRTLFSIEKRTHVHFFCEKCKNEKHLEITNLDFLNKEIKGKICHFQIDISGICEKCSKKT